ncbi:DUF1904 domain-containing protein [Bdellovibrio bacteriovorus]|nr:DUF1904 domain-containing protein [Bdellovibrio bacteriovorus]
MPHIRMRALKKEHVQNLSEILVKDLAKTIGTAEDNFTFEWIGSEFFSGGKATPSYPFVEVLWFARSQEVQDQTAALITQKVKTETQAQDVVVVFQTLDKAAYYENGEHF